MAAWPMRSMVSRVWSHAEWCHRNGRRHAATRAWRGPSKLLLRRPVDDLSLALIGVRETHGLLDVLGSWSSTSIRTCSGRLVMNS